jgi:hypothetical protein
MIKFTPLLFASAVGNGVYLTSRGGIQNQLVRLAQAIGGWRGGAMLYFNRQMKTLTISTLGRWFPTRT